MFQKLAVALALQMLQRALCQIFGFYADSDDCPDNVCDEVLSELDQLDDDSPMVTMAPGKTQALDFDVNWELINDLVQDGLKFIRTLRAFLGLDSRVG